MPVQCLIVLLVRMLVLVVERVLLPVPVRVHVLVLVLVVVIVGGRVLVLVLARVLGLRRLGRQNFNIFCERKALPCILASWHEGVRQLGRRDSARLPRFVCNATCAFFVSSIELKLEAGRSW